MFASIPIPSHNASAPRSPVSNNGAPAHPPQRHALVLNWEDVLVPMTLLAGRIGLDSTRQAMEQARMLLAQDAYLQQALASIEEQAIALLTAAARLGPVFLITEKSLKYMEITCRLFFPRLATFLLNTKAPSNYTPNDQYHQLQLHRVRVVAAPRKFASAMEVAQWKTGVFHSVCVDQVQRDASYAFSLISVSASERDAHFCVDAAQKTAASLAVPKCVTAEAQQSLEAFFAQLQTLQRYVSTAAMHATAFSMRL